MVKCMMKIKLKIHNSFVEYLYKFLYEQGEIIDEILTEPYGTTRYEILRLHLAILDLKINLIKEIFKIK